MRHVVRILVVFMLLVGLQLGLATPKLVFDDAGFDYYGNSVGYLHFARDAAADVLTVTLNDQAEPNGLPLTIAGLEAGLSQDGIYDSLGIDVSRKSLEIAFPADQVKYLDLLTYFHAIAPTLGFMQEQALVAGNTYMFACGCQLQKDTHLRVSFNQADNLIFVRLVLQTPLAY